jgi:hypothetical protein
LQLDEKEAQTLAKAIAEVEPYYPSVRGIMSGKIAAHVMLASTAAGIYAPRAVAIFVRMEKERKEKAPPPVGPVDTTNVTSIRPGETFKPGPLPPFGA